MRVKELRAKLSEFDDDMLVIVEMSGTAYVFFEACEVSLVHYSPRGHWVESARTDNNAIVIQGDGNAS